MGVRRFGGLGLEVDGVAMKTCEMVEEEKGKRRVLLLSWALYLSVGRRSPTC